ncbi:hypothetical protein Q1695_000353 [Nippostrongylus brasiliensis]|nr:hypothetical protein Q1695_000353 [Nippostrongylus brasiliensis]
MIVTNYASFIQFHDYQNCFAYTGNSNSPDDPSSHSRGNIRSTPLGHFRIRSCTQPYRYLHVQVFGKFPFAFILVNRKLANLAKFTADEEVILEQVNPTVCTAIGVVPASQHDYEILDKSSTEVEQVFLQQIRVVAPNMKFPLWVSSNVCVTFRVDHILPSTNDAVLLLSSTELHIISASNEMDVLEKDVLKVGRAYPHLYGSMRSDYQVSGLAYSAKLFRVIPNSLCEKNRIPTGPSHPNVIYTVGKENSNYTTYGIMSMRTHIKSQEEEFVMVIEVPQSKVAMDSNFKYIARLLTQYSCRDFCVIPAKDSLAYTTISLTTVENQRLVVADQVDVSLSKEEVELLTHDRIQRDILDALLDIVSIQPVLVPADGLALNVSVRGRPTMLHLAPVKEKKAIRFEKNCCYVIDSTARFNIKNEPSPQAILAISQTEPDNYGFVTNDTFVDIPSQSTLIDELVRYVEHSWSHEGFGHAILTGAEGSGKTSITAMVARRLAREHCCLSTRIDCTTWKGKQSEYMEKSLAQEIKTLSARLPSFLILDDFDFLSTVREDDQRQLDVDRIFEMLYRQMLKSRVPILVTAKNLMSLHKSVVNPGGRRLFSIIKNVPSFDQKRKEKRVRM